MGRHQDPVAEKRAKKADALAYFAGRLESMAEREDMDEVIDAFHKSLDFAEVENESMRIKQE